MLLYNIRDSCKREVQCWKYHNHFNLLSCLKEWLLFIFTVDMCISRSSVLRASSINDVLCINTVNARHSCLRKNSRISGYDRRELSLYFNFLISYPIKHVEHTFVIAIVRSSPFQQCKSYSFRIPTSDWS